MVTHRSVVALILGFLITPAFLNAQSDTLPTDPAARFGRLDNGMRYVIRPNSRPEQRAELRLVLNAGSILERDDQLGLAHFTEHMAFNGTRDFARQALVLYLEGIGMRFGPDLNAYTSFDETVYMLQIPTDRPGVIDTAFQVLANWAGYISLDSLEVERERGVVIEEWRGGRGAGARMRDQQFPVFFHGSRYAERLPIGSERVLATFDHAVLRQFHTDWYRPDLMAVIAVGDFDPAVVEELIRRHLGAIPSRRGPERLSADVPNHADTLITIATDAEATSTSVGFLLKQPLTEMRTIADYRADLTSALIAGMLSQRLFELAQGENPPFLGAGGGRGGLVRTKDVVSFNAGVQGGGALRGLEALVIEAERARRFGFAPSEIERQRVRMLRSAEQAMEERDRTSSAAHAGAWVANFLSASPVLGAEQRLNLQRELLPAIDSAAVHRMVGDWFSRGSLVIAVNGPAGDDASIPTASQLHDVLRRVAGTPLTPYVDAEVASELVAEHPTPGRIVSERRHEGIDVLEWQLSNGATVFLKSTDFQADQIMFQAWSPGGYSLVDDAGVVSAREAASIVTGSGLGTHSAADLRRVLAGKVAQLQGIVLEEREGLIGGASGRDLESLFQLAYLHFTAPRLDATAFQAHRGRMTAALANRSASPEAAFGDTLSVIMAQHHARRAPVTPAIVESLALDQAAQFYRERFSNAADFTFFLVGSFHPDSVRGLVATWIGGLPATAAREQPRDLGIRPPEGVIERVVRRGVEPRARTQIVFTGSFSQSRENRHILRSLGEALQIRLREVIREDLGGTYGVGVSTSNRVFPDTSYTISIGFGSAPERLEELVLAVWAEIEAFQQAGPAADVLDRVKEAQRRGFETSLRQNPFWIGQLVNYHQWGMNPSDLLRAPELFEITTPDMLRDAARAWITRDRYVRVSLMPEGATP